MICILIINLLLPASLFSQSSQTRRSRNRQQESLAAAIGELLKLAPLPPESLDDRATDGFSNRSGEDKPPPADDAPIEKLIEYWSRYGGAEDTSLFYESKEKMQKPTDKVRYRLLEACEDRPWLLTSLLNLMPGTPDACERLYRLLTEENDIDKGWREGLHRWLMFHSNYFRGDLIAHARSINNYNVDTTGVALVALAKLDWEEAKPILESLAGGATQELTPVGLSLLYKRAVEKNDDPQAENYRAQLKEIVTNPMAREDARAFALRGLMSTEWSGQEEWFVSLFNDPVLTGFRKKSDGPDSEEEGDKVSKRRTSNWQLLSSILDQFPSSLLSLALDSKRDRWIPVVTKLVGNNTSTVHNGAVGFLNDYVINQGGDKQLRREAARLLLPWLTDTDWSFARRRFAFIRNLGDLDLPESVSGLIWVLENDESNENSAAAAIALCVYRSPSAIPALRRALEREEDEPFRGRIVTALALSGGFSDDEMAAAIEAYAGMISTSEGEEEVNRSEKAENAKPLPLKISIGRTICESREIQVTEGLAAILFARVDELRSKQPKVARQILNKIRAAPFRIAEVKLIERISEGTAEIDDLTLALKTRDSLRNSVAEELHAMTRQTGYLSGIAAAVIDDQNGIKDLLAGKDSRAQLALLACARYLRDRLPIDLVGPLLSGRDRILAKAAENYLDVEDSAEARKLILAKHPHEALILGDIYQFRRRHNIEHIVQWEERMRRQVLSQNIADEIYSVLFPSDTDNFSGIVIRVSRGKAELSVSEVEGRRRGRLLSENEFQELKYFTSRQEVDSLGPESRNYDDDNKPYYVYLRLTREGGRRILFDHFERTPKNPTLHEELAGLFYKLTKSGEFKERYSLEDKVPGLEVMMADDKQRVSMVCMEGRQVRVLVGEKDFGSGPDGLSKFLEWRSFSSGNLGSPTDEPSACRPLDFVSKLKKIKDGGVSFDPGLKTDFSRSGEIVVFTNYSVKERGIWKVEPGSEPVKILSGKYSAPLFIDNKKLLFAIKDEYINGEDNSTLIRYNTETGRESVITPPQEGFYYPAAYLADQGKILVTHGYYLSNSEQSYLLDTESGIMQPVKGNFRPLFDQSQRPLQPTGRPHEYWSALYNAQKRATTIGLYNAKSFVFKPLLDLNDIRLSSADIWADLENKKLWVTYKGHLLRLPLPEQVK
jgi:HEAT repeats